MAAAALALVVDDSRDDAVRELLLERERLAMALADRDSFLAQRHFYVSDQVQRPERLITWQQYWHSWNSYHLSVMAAVRDAFRHLRDGHVRAALDILQDEVSDESDEDL